MKKSAIKFLIICSAAVLPLLAMAEVSKISFTTEEQTIKPGAISEPITIQTQDSSGNPFQTPETIDLEFVSSSATGEFLNSSGNPATKTMSVNTANRTFYYRDSSEGAHTITVNATGRTSLTEWSASQKITVTSGTSSENTGGEVLSETTGFQESKTLSATSGSSAPSYATQSTLLEVSAGGDRITSPGSPINFQAQIKKNTVSNQAVSFSWSFGDGNVGVGALVSHSYKYPGDYAVVLNAKAGNIFAVSRLKVKVINPLISLALQDGYIEISNDTNSEINLFNWKLVSGNRGFIFQPDTIILPKSKLKIDKSLLTMKGEAESGTMLKNYLGEAVSFIPLTSKNEVNDIAAKADEVQRQTYALVSKAIELNLVEESPAPKIRAAKTEQAASVSLASQGEAPVQADSPDTQENQNILYEVPEERSFISKIVAFFGSIFD
jgi:hypothetical protein